MSFSANFEFDRASETPGSRCDDALFQPSTELWYTDGNIIIVAGDEGFRVYAGLLSAHSIVFADLLNVPQPTPQATYDGCPVVWVEGSAVDMRVFLRAVLDTRYVLHDLNHSLSFRALCSLLRLSTKYSVSHIRRHTIIALQHYFPTTFDAFYVAREARRTHALEGVADYFMLANTARAAHATVLLPAILFSCAVQQLGVILDGNPVASGSSRMVELSTENKRAVLQSRHQLCHLARTVTLRPLYLDKCRAGNQQCMSARREAAAVHLEGRKSDGFLNPLSRFHDLEETSVCASCRAELQESVEEGRQSVWEKIPDIFGLGSWETVDAET